MPLLRFDAIEGRSETQVKTLLDAAHRAVLSAFNVPPRDRYQIYQEHPAHHLVVEDTGLGIPRTKDVLIVTVISKPRSKELKERFYAELCEQLSVSCGIASSDVVVSFVINSAEDWSFGNGRAQFLTGEL
jgi:hypothetical protein